MKSERPTESSGPVTLTVVCSSEQVAAELKEIRERICRAPGYLQWMALQVLKAGESGIELAHVDPDHCSTPCACELRVLPQLSKQLRLLLLALRAHEGEGEVGVFAE